MFGSHHEFGWLNIVRLGLIQTAIGAIVVVTTSMLNRIMVVELALPAILPGALVGWHYAVQLSRPRWGFGADEGGRRSPWILGGMSLLALGAVGAALSTALMETTVLFGTISAILAFFMIGIGVGASGTNLLAMLAMHTPPARKAAAAAIVWIMMIFGFVLTATTAGSMLDPFSLTRMIFVTTGVSAFALVLTGVSLIGLEPKRDQRGHTVAAKKAEKPCFRAAIAEIWDEPQARRFTIFIFVSMLAYSTQDLILEPFAGLIHGFTPGESTRLAGVQNGGVLLGMILTAIVGTTIGRSRGRFMRRWTAAGCLASALSLFALSVGAAVGPGWPVKLNVFLLGLSNGAFAVAAIGSMMALASAGRPGREGTRMGLWGASQAIAFGLGGFLGAVAIDLTRMIFDSPGLAFSVVFGAEALTFVVAAGLALRVGHSAGDDMVLPAMPSMEAMAAE